MPERAILAWLLIGLIVGALSRITRPGGIFVTLLIGIAGALLGGFIAGALGIGRQDTWPSYAAAVIGAIALLVLYRLIAARRVG
ncbi:hypothetical protein GCM10023219_16390 [Stakelama sediminis]|uniref:Putative membrane protein YeaQ/YmgE (Transglycosylase-associated protein family) n=1 Tax=Stakelama sediminis TaxID=463200 RepID=A0A840YXH6_9SPHN|nr:GlsB/YeaQ/YmgE family stress response membrane protein [Stakelama sediminis]MBB5718368.1 putative membrane protein YeaQ/YmgE (transglycosylase-associated protein family) [Stakelama sediminis]